LRTMAVHRGRAFSH